MLGPWDGIQVISVLVNCSTRQKEVVARTGYNGDHSAEVREVGEIFVFLRYKSLQS